MMINFEVSSHCRPRALNKLCFLIMMISFQVSSDFNLNLYKNNLYQFFLICCFKRQNKFADMCIYL